MVEAISSVRFATLAATADAEPLVAISIAGGDPSAVAVAAGIVAAVGFAQVTAGPLRTDARLVFGTDLLQNPWSSFS